MTYRDSVILLVIFQKAASKYTASDATLKATVIKHSVAVVGTWDGSEVLVVFVVEEVVL
jgi:hypothetical protein